MTKKVFGFFMIVSILALAVLLSWYFKNWEPSLIKQDVAGIPNVPSDPETDTEDGDTGKQQNQEISYNQDVYSVHLCDRYSDGTFAIRNIKLGMNFFCRFLLFL